MTTEKTIDTLVDDIYALFKDGDQAIEFGDHFFQNFGKGLEDIMSLRFQEKRDDTPRLRMSNIGRPDRQLWYDMHPDGSKEPFLPSTLIKFAYGDMIEEFILMLAKMAGHDVKMEQGEVGVDGIKGHIDCMIDGVVVDIKSASTYSFKKFESGELLEGKAKDPFGYVAQMAGYVEALTPGKGGAFLAVDKTLGKLTLLKVPAEVLQPFDVKARIAHIKDVVEQDAAPERCYEDVPDGKSGNMKLDIGCSYCSHKFRCWPELKTYYYSNGPRYLTKVVREPKVSGEAYDPNPFAAMGNG